MGSRFCLRGAILATCLAIGVVLPTSAHARAYAQEAPSCSDVEPRDQASFSQVAATPGSEETGNQDVASPVASPTAFAMPEGGEVDAETLAEVENLYQQLVSCINDGDYLRAYALYSDGYLSRNLSAEAIASLTATPVPTDESMQTEFQGVLDARMLDDGRVAALVSTANPQTGSTVLFSILRQGDSGWQIDEENVVEAQNQATPEAMATPAA